MKKEKQPHNPKDTFIEFFRHMPEWQPTNKNCQSTDVEKNKVKEEFVPVYPVELNSAQRAKGFSTGIPGWEKPTLPKQTQNSPETDSKYSQTAQALENIRALREAAINKNINKKPRV